MSKHVTGAPRVTDMRRAAIRPTVRAGLYTPPEIWPAEATMMPIANP